MSRTLTQFRALSESERIDADAGIIYGVSVMTIGPALGHGIDIDRTGLEQCLAACKATEPDGIKLTYKHDGEMEDLVGVVKNFRIEGDQLRGDAHLFDTAPQRARVLEIAAKAPKVFGLSVETTGEHEPVPNTKKLLYRCDEIDAVALVPKPAANKSGMFSQPPKKMDPEEIKEAVTEAVGAAIAPIEERLSKLENPEGDPEKEKENLGEGEDKDKLSKKELKSLLAEAAQAGAAKAITSLGVKRPPSSADPEPADKKGKLTRFEAKAEEMARSGVKNPFMAAVAKYPDLYNEHREITEKGGK